MGQVTVGMIYLHDTIQENGVCGEQKPMRMNFIKSRRESEREREKRKHEWW